MSNQENSRVLGRTGARQLTDEESKKIHGGIGTATLCTAPGPGHPHGDGDPGEC